MVSHAVVSNDRVAHTTSRQHPGPLPTAFCYESTSIPTPFSSYAGPPRVFLFYGLRAVSRLLVAEFYGSTLWYPAQCLVELNRLQENFHGYGDDADRHLMLLATSVDDGSVVGFVDVDGREKRPGQSECGSIVLALMRRAGW